MNIILIFAVIWASMIATSFIESSVEGRNAWGKKTPGWRIRYYKQYDIFEYAFWAYFIKLPLLTIVLPLVINGWDPQLFGILLSAFLSGIVIEDFVWYVINPVVKLKEFWTSFSDYYPWIKIGKYKIIPLGYIIFILASIASWFFFWK